MLWAVLYHDMSQDSVITIMIVNIFETIAQLYLLAMHYLSVVIVAIVLASLVTASPSNCSKTYQQLLDQAAAVKRNCSEAALKDCCQVSAVLHCETNLSLCYYCRSRTWLHGPLLVLIKWLTHVRTPITALPLAQ